MPVGIKQQNRRIAMKKFLVVLLSLGLIAAFAATGSAADVKFSGTYYVAGFYEDNPTMGNKDQGAYSRAAMWQRWRFMPVITVADGLTFTTRFDALEKGWGNIRGYLTSVKYSDQSGGRDEINNVSVNKEENFELEFAYLTAKTAFG